MTKLHELVHLSAPLVFADLFTVCEGGSQFFWSKEKSPEGVGCLAYRKKDLVYFYYNPELIDWKMTESSKFDEQILLQKSSDAFSKIREILIKENPLNREQLKEFIPEVILFWKWFDGIWWRIEFAEKNKIDYGNLMSLRKETEYFVPSLRLVIRKSFKEILDKRYEQYIDVLRLNEVLESKLPSIEELNSRLESYVVINGKLFNNIESALKEFDFDMPLDEVDLNSKELHGQCAFPGRVKSKIKIVNSVDDLHKFSSGDIIVSSTTTPDFLPIMKISKAIISEHGGIICHAAITSRELKIPCVVGVKNATKILKDGDMVEVDADRGIVKIIK